MDNFNENIYTQYPMKKKRNAMAIASMILGIVSLVMCCLIYVSVPCAILSVVLGAVSLRKGKSAMAVAGIILGGISIAMAIMISILMVIGIIAYIETNGIEYALYHWGLIP